MLRLLLQVIVIVAGLLSFPPAKALFDFDLDIGNFEGEGWSMQGAALHTQINAAGQLELTLDIKAIQLPEKIAPIKDIVVKCPELVLSSTSARCAKGDVRVIHPSISSEPFAISLEYTFDGRVNLSFEELRLNEGVMAGRVRWSESAWSASIRGDALDLALWVKDLARVYPDFDFAVSGKANLEGDLTGDKHDLRTLVLKLDSENIAFTDSASTRVGEDVGVQIRLNAQQHRAEWVLDTALALHQGQIYLEPIYLELKNHPLRVKASAIWREDAHQLEINSLTYADPATLRLSAGAQVVFAQQPELVSLDLRIIQAKFPTLYSAYLQPVLIGSTLDSLETSGQLSGHIQYRKDQSTSVDVRINGLDLDDGNGRFGVSGLHGQVRWHNQDEPLISKLRFDGGHVYKVGLGHTDLLLENRNRDVRLLKPTNIPILDGNLLVESFNLRDATPSALEWRFDASLTPISMESFTAAIGWPVMLGELSGMIPEVRYKQGELTVGGALLVRVFDGTITMNNLRLQDPLGPIPQLNANATINNLDLNALTRTFSFGKIEGRLGGHVRGLELVNWEPVQFDAVIKTPEDDRSRHRISQRAVDNLTSLSSGVTGALSSGFLGLFEEFAYDRIGVSCRLSGGVCEMDGVAPAKDGGYYIVTGAGLPRIDIIGYSHQVDWLELVDRLKNINLNGGAVID